MPFAGFEMPVQYPGGITAEHHAVRKACGLFDVSHMGEFEITGPDRNAFVNRITSNDVSRLEPGGAAAITERPDNEVEDAEVASLDESLEKVKALGGELLVGPRKAGPTTYAVIRDPAGAICSLIEMPAQMDATTAALTEPAATANADACAFYTGSAFEGRRWLALRRVDGKAVNKRILEGLIKSGAFDWTGEDRASLFARIDQAIAEAEHRGCAKIGVEPQLCAIPMHHAQVQRIAADEDYGRVVCFCERVTRGEVRDAFASNSPPSDLDGLRRRTRALMGRCQGFYCGAEVSRLLEDHERGTS